MSVAVDDVGTFIRLNAIIQAFYRPGTPAGFLRDAAVALAGAYTAQRAAHAATYPDSEYLGTETITLTSEDPLRRPHSGDPAFRDAARLLDQVLYNTGASDGTQYLDPACERTLLRIRGDLWKHLTGD